MDRVVRWIDLPPVWLIATGAAMAVLARQVPLARFGGDLSQTLGWLVILAAVLLMGWAVLAFRRHDTTVVPRRDPSALVTDGPFRFSRNPIYLADAAILLGWALILGAVSPLLLVPVFVAVIDRRFIVDEEAALARAYPEAFAAFRTRTRRWL